MLSPRDLQELEQAARLIISIIERHNVSEENATERRTLFRVVHSNETPPATEPTAFICKNKEPGKGMPGVSEQGFVEFTEQEILTMPKKLQRLIILQKQRCRLRTRKCGTSYTYEIRLRRDGYNVSASGKTIELAKSNMLRKLASARPTAPQEQEHGVPETFNAFAICYFERFRKEKVSEQTYRTDFGRYKKYLAPFFGEKPLKKITPSDCKTLIDDVKTAGKGKTADELYSLLSIIFKGAIAHGILQRNPLDVVLHVQHERESGCALSKEEEKALFDSLSEWPFACAAALSLYCGLRPNELATVRIENEFVVAVNSKRHSRKVEYKKIPICNRLRPFLENLPALPSVKLLRRRIKAALPEHKLYDLRTTFYSRCKEFGVATPALMEFAGHSLGKLGNAYTDLSEEYLLKEGKKLNQW